MSIYITDLIATEAAKALCDDHIKSYPEQILNICKYALTVDYITGVQIEWCRISKQNLEWMIEFGIAVCNIYTAIWMKNHPLKKDFQKLKQSLEKSKKFPKLGITRRLMNCPEKYRKLGYIEANREIYNINYKHLYYSPCRTKPKWLS